MAIREIVVKDGEVKVKASGTLTTQDLDIAQSHIYMNKESIRELRRQIFDFTEVEDCNLSSAQIFYLAVLDNSALLTNPDIELIKIAPSEKVFNLCCEWHQNLIVNANTKILRR